jgi:hypothetical protein
MQSLKEAKMKQILSLFKMTTQTNIQLSKLEAAVGTMHDIPAFGELSCWAERWPTAVDILKMPMN